MSDPGSANVQSVDAIKDVRTALIKFHERATSAMGDLRQKIDRTVSWLELDRPNYWREQERRAYDLVASTRVALETCRLRTVGGRKSDCIEEKKAFERAKMRMEYVREKQQAVRKWMVQAGRETNEYRSRTSTFLRALEQDVPLMIAQLGRMIDAIEAYSESQSFNPSSPPTTSSSTNPDTDSLDPGEVSPERPTPVEGKSDETAVAADSPNTEPGLPV